jgi:hypothetical protein
MNILRKTVTRIGPVLLGLIALARCMPSLSIPPNTPCACYVGATQTCTIIRIFPRDP